MQKSRDFNPKPRDFNPWVLKPAGPAACSRRTISSLHQPDKSCR
jgi:hypothetical protein